MTVLSESPSLGQTGGEIRTPATPGRAGSRRACSAAYFFFRLITMRKAFAVFGRMIFPVR
jgi:hypothetical protein